MNRILSVLGLTALMFFAGCQKDDTMDPIPARPHADVYPEDLAKLEAYLKAHYVDITDTNTNGKIDVEEIVIDSLDLTHTVSIWDQTAYPLQFKMVNIYGVNFKVYYLKFAPGTGDSPCGVDRILTSYKGLLLDGTQFDFSPNAVEFNMIGLVKGWEYIFPEFKTGTTTTNGDGTLNHSDYGSGVMFLPSGLGYYNAGFGNIPNYAPLVFTFNLYAVNHLDQDFDGIESRFEYAFNADGTLIDTDSDGVPNVFDADDDNDGYLTKDEIRTTLIDVTPDPDVEYTFSYPYNGAAVDDPATFINETHGIPNCGNTDFTSPTRLRKHLDPSCH
jgi:hypothetical protein